MINLKTNEIYTKEEIINKSKNGNFINTDGIRDDMDGKGMAEFLQSIGFTILYYRDINTNGIVVTKEGVTMSTNGYCYMKR